MAETLYHCGNKTHVSLKIFRAGSIPQENEGKTVIIVHATEHVKLGVANDICKQLFDSLSNGLPFRLPIKRILILDTVYKTKYTTTDPMAHMEIKEGTTHYPLKYYKSSHLEEDTDETGGL